MLTVFRACGAHDDGTWMSCHWANQAVNAIAIGMVILAGLHFMLFDPRRKQGLDLGLIVFAVTAFLIPGRMIDLCMMADMRCRKLMVPGVTVLSVVILIVSAVDLILQVGRMKKTGPGMPPGQMPM